MANWNRSDALFCISEASLSAYVPFVPSSFQGKKYSHSLKMLMVTQPWWMYLNLKIYDHNPVICSVRMIIPAILWDQPKNCWTRKLFVRNYTKKMIGSEFETDIVICSCCGCPPLIFPLLPKQDEIQVLVLSARDWKKLFIFSLIFFILLLWVCNTCTRY